MFHRPLHGESEALLAATDGLRRAEFLHDGHIDPLFEAAIQAVEEA